MALFPTSSVLRLPFALGACVPAAVSHSPKSAPAAPNSPSIRPVPQTIRLNWEMNGSKENHDA